MQTWYGMARSLLLTMGLSARESQTLFHMTESWVQQTTSFSSLMEKRQRYLMRSRMDSTLRMLRLLPATYLTLREFSPLITASQNLPLLCRCGAEVSTRLNDIEPGQACRSCAMSDEQIIRRTKYAAGL